MARCVASPEETFRGGEPRVKRVEQRGVRSDELLFFFIFRRNHMHAPGKENVGIIGRERQWDYFARDGTGTGGVRKGARCCISNHPLLSLSRRNPSCEMRRVVIGVHIELCNGTLCTQERILFSWSEAANKNGGIRDKRNGWNRKCANSSGQRAYREGALNIYYNINFRCFFLYINPRQISE